MTSSGHVIDEPLPGGDNHVFPEHDMHNYGSMYAQGTDGSFDPSGWPPLDQNSLAFPGAPQSSLHQNWNTTHNLQHVSRSLPQQSSSYATNQNFYGAPFSNAPSSYANSAYANQGTNHHVFPQPTFDPSLVPDTSMAQPDFEMGGMSQYSTSSAQPRTIAPEALQQNHSLVGNGSVASGYQIPHRTTPSQQPYKESKLSTASQPSTNIGQVQRQPLLRTPKGNPSGRFIVVDNGELLKATRSTKLHHFLALGKVAHDISHIKTGTTIPQYIPRISRNDFKKLAAGNRSLLTKVEKSGAKHKATRTLIKNEQAKASGLSVRSPSSLKEDYSESSSEESSSDESEYESSDGEEEPPQKSPLPPTRPQDPMQAVRYDVLKAVWSPNNRPVESERIRSGISDYWEVLATIRDRWKSNQASLKEAEEKKKQSELPALKDRVKKQRDMMEMACKAAILHGHPDIVRLFGESPKFLYIMTQFMIDRNKESDHNGSLSKAILEVLSRCETVTAEALEKTKLTKVLALFTKKGDEKVKSLVASITATASGSKAKKENTPENPSEGKAPDATRRPAPEPVIGVKRPRTVDGKSEPPSKKASSAESPNATQSSIRGGTSNPPAKRVASGTSTATSTVAKPGGHKVVAKPTSFFSSLQSASKKPNTSNATKPTSSTLPKKTNAAPAASMAPKGGFSFAETMANLMKPKEEKTVPKAEAQGPPETEEERAKRLRKEERRKLRVAWKPETSLVSIRYFSRDPEEEIGTEIMHRDVRDVGSEGRMFKQHKDQIDDENSDLPPEEDFFPWKEPSMVDFSVVSEDERKRNYAPYGGGHLTPSCPEREAQERREASTLMVFYSHPSDIPPNPREPTIEDDFSNDKPATAFGEPGENVIRRFPPGYRPTIVPPPPPTSQPNIDINAILKQLGTPQPQETQNAPYQQQQQPPAPPAPVATDNLDKIFSLFSNQQTSAPQPQVPAATQQPPPPPDLASLLATAAHAQAQAKQGQQAQSTQAPQPPPIPHPPFPPAPNMDFNSFLASLQQNGMPNFPVPPFPFPMPSQQLPQHDGQSAQHHHFDSSEGINPERLRRLREQDESSNSNKKRKFNKNKGGKGYNGPTNVIPCRYWKEGNCKKGDACTYIHER